MIYLDKCQHCKYKISDFGGLCSKGYDSKFKDKGIGCNGFKEIVFICNECKNIVSIGNAYSETYCSEECANAGLERYRKEKERALLEKKELEVKLEEAHKEIEDLNKVADIKVLLEKSIMDIKSLTEEENNLLIRYTDALNKRGYAIEAMPYLKCYYEV